MSGLPRLCKGRERDPSFTSSPLGVGWAPWATHLSIEQRVAEWEEVEVGQWWWEKLSGKGYRCSL